MIRGVVVKGYCSVQETAKRWGISVRWVNQYALEGRIPGAERLGDSGRRGQTGKAQIRAQAERNVKEKQQEGLNR